MSTFMFLHLSTFIISQSGTFARTRTSCAEADLQHPTPHRPQAAVLRAGAGQTIPPSH